MLIWGLRMGQYARIMGQFTDLVPDMVLCTIGWYPVHVRHPTYVRPCGRLLQVNCKVGLY